MKCESLKCIDILLLKMYYNVLSLIIVRFINQLLRWLNMNEKKKNFEKCKKIK